MENKALEGLLFAVVEPRSNYPTIEQVCQIASKVFQEENKTWKVRPQGIISHEEVLLGGKFTGLTTMNRSAADCRAICMHIISKHVPVYNAADRRDQLLTNGQIGNAMGGVRTNVVWILKRRACKLFSRVEYGCIYYAIIHQILAQGYELWALPKDLKQPQRA